METRLLDIPAHVAPEQLPELLALALDASHDAIIVTDCQLSAPGPYILYCNPAFSRITGYDRAELLGHSPRMLQGARTSRRVLDKIRSALLAVRPVRAATWNYHKSGKPFYMEWSMAPVLDSKGQLRAYMAVQRNITGRVRRHRQFVKNERDLLRRMLQTQETERTRIGKDLHDSLGQKLSVLKMLNAVLLRHPDTSDTLRPSLAETSALLEESIEELRSLARALTPRALSSRGLSGALIQLRDQNQVAKGPELHLEFNIRIDELPDRDTLLLYRIIQELLNNTYKHSHARQIHLRLVVEEAQGQIRLDYRDDGVGMPTVTSGPGLGLQTIQDRVRLLHGSLQQVAPPGAGVHYVGVFPLRTSERP